MSVSKRVKELLEESGIDYEHHEHARVYTAQEVASVEHVPGQEFAKSVILTDGDQFLMAVLPATRKIVLDELRAITGNDEIRLATEEEFGGLFPNTEIGAMAPFGNLYDMAVYVDQSLEEDEKITFNAGTHEDSIQMAYADYARLVEPEIGEFSAPL